MIRFLKIWINLLMDSLVIGIVATEQIIDNKSYEAVVRNNLKYLNNKCSFIGLIMYDLNGHFDTNILDNCDGVIFQGGTDIYPFHFEILNYCINNNIPVLGICMGMQIIGLYNNKQLEEDLVKIDKHYGTNHKISIDKKSVLYDLFGDNMIVNSRHNFVLGYINNPFIISAKSEDGVIEATEFIDKEHFVLGLQFHPEDMENMDKLYNYFIKECLIRKNNYGT